MKNINCGYGYTIITDNNNNIHVIGNNTDGRLGTGTGNYLSKYERHQLIQTNNMKISKTFTSPFGYTTFWLTDENRLYGNGQNTENQLLIQR